MIIIKNKEVINSVNFPRSTSNSASIYNLVLTNIAQVKDYSFTGLTNTSNTNLFYQFTIDLSELPNGEYKYAINDKYIGLLRIGDYKPIYKESTSKKYSPNVGGDIFYEG